MLRSLYSGISGLRSHQTMLDVTGNNIANVNTSGFKSSTVQFQDTLSQMTQGAAGPQAEAGGRNPAQIGLGVQVAGVTTNFGQGSAQATGRATDMMIAGDGFFITSNGGQQAYTRSGSFDFDAQGRLVTPDGSILQGWGANNGVVNAGGAVGNIQLDPNLVSAATPTTAAAVGGNLPAETPVNGELVRDVRVFDANGIARDLSLTFTRTATGWDVAGADANGATGTDSLTFTDGKLTAGGTLNVGGIAVNLGTVTGYANMTTVSVTGQNGRSAGTLESFSIGPDGTLVGTFTNGARQDIARVALATFTNPAGLEKNGGSSYIATANSGAVQLATAGAGGAGTLTAGAIEMSNVDLSQEFTNLIVAQRGFQANSRIITTSDDVLQELVNLKR